MDKKKSLDLIKLEVLGCISEKDGETLQAFKNEGEDFPWKELGDYQNVISMLPLTIEMKYPASDLKDKTAMKLYGIRDQIKAKIDARKAEEMPTEPIEEVSQTTEEIEIHEVASDNIPTEHIEIEENVFAEVEEGFSLNTEAALGKEEPARFSGKHKEKSNSESLFKQSEEVETREPVKAVIDKEAIEKITREFVKSHVDRELVSLRNNVNKNKMLSFILFAVALILIVVTFFLK